MVEVCVCDAWRVESRRACVIYLFLRGTALRTGTWGV